MNVNTRVMILVMVVCTARYTPIHGMELPTVSELCRAGAELFCCRPAKPGTELLSCCATKQVAEFAQIAKTDVIETPQVARRYKDLTTKQKQVLFRKYENAKEAGIYISSDMKEIAEEYKVELGLVVTQKHQL